MGEVSSLTDVQAIPVKIMLVDDHEVVRVGLKSLLERVPGFQIIAEAGTVQGAVQQVERLASDGISNGKAAGLPDVIVMDVRMPDGSGVEACRSIRSRYPQIKVIMLTSYTDNEAIFASVMAGAAGYVLKQIGSEELVRAIRTVHAGGSLLDPETTRRVLEHMRAGQVPAELAGLQHLTDDGGSNLPQRRPTISTSSPLTDLPEPLTEQEQRILALIAEGKTNREIAEDIFLSEKTVRNYVSNILGKLNLSNRAEAAAFAVRHGITVHRV